jgi:hypothetical protein
MTHVRSIETDRVENQLVRIRSLLEASEEPTREERIREAISIMHGSERDTRDQQLIQRQTQLVINGFRDGPMNGTEGSASTEAAGGEIASGQDSGGEGVAGEGASAEDAGGEGC